jgi:hypothetical protein
MTCRSDLQPGKEMNLALEVRQISICKGYRRRGEGRGGEGRGGEGREGEGRTALFSLGPGGVF